MNKLLQLVKTNLAMLFNAASLVGTTAITSILGVVYWWIAARFFSQTAIGLASAMLSVMSFLGTIAMLGLGTLLTGELPRQPGKEWSLINGALIVVGGAGTVAGIIFAFLAPMISPELNSVWGNALNISFFALGVGLTALTLVLDQALIGILRGGLQLWRNTLFSIVKLVALIGAAFLATKNAGMAIYVTWLIGNLLSLVVLFSGQKAPAPAPQEPEKRVHISSPLGIEKSIKLPCPDCGALSPNGASFCLECGYPFSPTIELTSVRPQLLFDYGTIGLADTTVRRRRKVVTDNHCPECEKIAPDNARFCPSCGYPLTPTMEIASIKISTPLPALKTTSALLPEPDTKQASTGLPVRFERARLALAEESDRLSSIRNEQSSGKAVHTPLPAEIPQTLPQTPIAYTPLPAVREQVQAGPTKYTYRPQWDLLRKLGKAAVQHHILNLILLAPTQILPFLVTVLISIQATAQFYVAFMLANFIFTLSYALSTVLYAVGAAQPDLLAQKTRFTLGLSFIACVGANLVAQVGAELLLSIFGHAYATQASWCLRILCLAVFPIIIKSHYLAICRVQERITQIILPIAIGSSLELIGAALGARFDGLLGVSLGWLVVLVFEAIYMSHTVYRAAYPTKATVSQKWQKSD